MNTAIMWMFLLLLSSGTDAARILMTSPQMRSHVLTQLSIGEELVQLGHEVHVAVANRFPQPEMAKKRGIDLFYYQYPLELLYPISEKGERLFVEPVFNSKQDWRENMQLIQDSIYDGCWYMMSDKAFLNRVKQMNFDLVLVEVFIGCPCHLILPYYLDIPFVSETTTFFPWHIGLPALPSSFAFMTPKEMVGYPDLSSFLGRIKSMATYVFFCLVAVPNFWSNTTLLQHYSNVDRPATRWLDLLRQSQLFIQERDHHLEEFPYPLLPNVIALPGLNANPAGPLSPDLEAIFTESSTSGVILVSFGATVSTSCIPVKVIEKFFDAFSRLPQTVLAKFDVPDGVTVPPNVKVLDWLPQNDILGHPNTILFITHCGNSGQYEAVYHGVPMLGMPLFAEQSWNCERATRKGFGLELSIFDFTVDQLTETIDRLIAENSTYRVEVKRMSAILKSYPMNGRQTAAYWIDHVIKFGGKHLRPISIEQPLYQFLMLDIVFSLGFFVALSVCSCAFFLRLTFSNIFRRHCTENSDLSKKTQ